MLRLRIFQILMAPFALIYGFGVLLRNSLYSNGILKEAKFSIPVIGIGNLALGGAGKTPHVEYLIRLLKPYVKVATLSRGYKRKSNGFRIVGRHDTALTVGDEPLQYSLKYRDVTVAVSESRSVGIPLLINADPSTQVILLDDSYQHRSVKPSLNILLTEYRRPYYDDHLLPMGRLREWNSGADRADIIIISKCPDTLSQKELNEIETKLELKYHQHLFFSRYIYGDLYHIIDGHRKRLDEFEEVTLLSAIANEEYLIEHLEKSIETVHPMSYEDHHRYSPHEVSLLKLQYEQIENPNKAIITTEKDATRLIEHRSYIIEQGLPIYILPLQVAFLRDEGIRFNTLVRDHLLRFTI